MKLGFSLIELLVVISIVAILAAIAMPAYTQYMGKVRVFNAINLLESKMRELSLHYQKYGKMPTTTTFLGTTLTGSGWQAIPQNSNNIAFATFSSGPRTAQIGVQLATSVVGDNNSFAIVIKDINGTMGHACGPAWYSATNIPYSYLPSSCQCADMSTYWNTGTGC